jgi:hypothetical protein
VSDTRDPAEEQQIADLTRGGPRAGEVAPAIDAAGIGQENPDAPELDDVGPDGDDIPDSDAAAGPDQPETQGEDPLVAELGDEGEGDLAPEDL